MRALSSTSGRKVALSPWERVLNVGLGAVLVLGGASLSVLLLQEALFPAQPGTQPAWVLLGGPER